MSNMRYLDVNTQDAHARFVYQRTAELTILQRQAEADQLRLVRINLIEGGLRGAVSRAPDAFGEIDFRSLATTVVDELL